MPVFLQPVLPHAAEIILGGRALMVHVVAIVEACLGAGVKTRVVGNRPVLTGSQYSCFGDRPEGMIERNIP